MGTATDVETETAGKSERERSSQVGINLWIFHYVDCPEGQAQSQRLPSWHKLQPHEANKSTVASLVYVPLDVLMCSQLARDHVDAFLWRCQNLCSLIYLPFPFYQRNLTLRHLGSVPNTGQHSSTSVPRALNLTSKSHWLADSQCLLYGNIVLKNVVLQDIVWSVC